MPDGKKTKLIPTSRAIMVALVAGALAGAVGVYVRQGLYGNNAPPGEDIAAAPALDDQCPAKTAVAEALAAKATGEVAAMSPANPPRSLRQLAFARPDSSATTLGDFAGKAILVNLWATWCAPCRAEMPSLNALQKTEGDEQFSVVAINVDTGGDAKPKKFLVDTGVDALGFYRESTLSLFNDLKRQGLVLGLPVTLLVDAEGCLLAHMNGPAEWAGDDARRLVAAAKSL